VRIRQGSGGADGRGGRLSPPDRLLRPACEAAVEVARAAAAAYPPVKPPSPLRPLVRINR
jgi:hypothetical protein